MQWPQSFSRQCRSFCYLLLSLQNWLKMPEAPHTVTDDNIGIVAVLQILHVSCFPTDSLANGIPRTLTWTLDFAALARQCTWRFCLQVRNGALTLNTTNLKTNVTSYASSKAIPSSFFSSREKESLFQFAVWSCLDTLKKQKQTFSPWSHLPWHHIQEQKGGSQSVQGGWLWTIAGDFPHDELCLLAQRQ